VVSVFIVVFLPLIKCPRSGGVKGRDERLSRIGSAKAEVPGVNALFCGAGGEEFSKERVDAGPAVANARKRKAFVSSGTPEAGGMDGTLADYASAPMRELALRGAPR
jgi:hypothetical protein